MKQQYNVGIYVRLSKDDERAGESLSIENQKLILTKYVREMGWNEAECYVDDGYSGTNFERPAVTRLIEDAKDGKINLILVKDLSRFGRNYIQVGQFTDYLFPMIGCRFIALNDGVDTINNDNDIMPFRNLFNEFQSRDTSKKIKAVKRACAGNGKYVGAFAPFGYKKSAEEKYKLIIDGQAAPIVQRIFDLRCKGYGYRKIAEALNREGVISPRDYYYREKGEPNPRSGNNLWNDISVKLILENEAYIGHLVQMKTGTLSYKNKRVVNRSPDEWVKVENTHKPIIDTYTWNLCREIGAKRYRARSRSDGELSLFSGLLKCMCGFKMRTQRETKVLPAKGMAKYIFYLCNTYSSSGKIACTTHTINERILVELVLEDLRKHTSRVLSDEEGLRQDLISQCSKESLRQYKADKEQLRRTQGRLLELEQLIQSLYEDRVLGSLSDIMCKTLMAKYEQEREEKSALLQDLTAKLAETEQDEQNIDSFLTAIKKYVAVEQLDREMLLELIDVIEIGERQIKNGQKYRDITIHYNFVGKIA